MSKTQEIKKIYDLWVNEIYDSQITKKLVAMTEKEILDGFCGELDFGTAGMRGIMGLGSNRMNEITVTRLASAVCSYLKENFENPSIVIGFDTRNNSKRFSRIFARVATSNGVKVYLFKNFCPTPVLSYSITNLKTSMGIMITASHNNKIYNGIKVSDQFGIQVSGQLQKTLSEKYEKANGISEYNKTYNIKLIKAKNLAYVGKEMSKKFIEYKQFTDNDSNLKIVYTPLNGTGRYCVTKLLKKNGFNVYIPKSQKKASGEFLTCPYPNPEFEEAFNEAKKLARKVDADIIIATDPDADRLGAMIKTKDGYYKLSGNEVGYIFLEKKASQNTNENAFAVSSVVTSPLALDISKANNVKMHRALTGFKNLGKVMFENINNVGKDAYVLCYEESCGYILRDDMFDKDGIFATLELCELAHNLKQQGKTVGDYLDDIYKKYGYLYNINTSITFEGNDATQKMNSAVEGIRNNKPTTLAGEDIVKVIDYEHDNTGLDKQNFIEFSSNNITAIVRPSGTEPKLKFYIFAKSENMETSKQIAEKVYEQLKEQLQG